MSVELDPPELGFKRPFQHEVANVLRLKNPHSDPVAFKVKTTAPKQYCVRPNSGRIEPHGEVEVQVLLQSMKEDPPPDAKCRDKFLVQSVAVSADREFSNVASIWSHIEETAKSSIQERKIRVVFLPADGSEAATPLKSNGITADHAPSSPSPDAVTPQRISDSTPSVTTARETVEHVAGTARAAVTSGASTVVAAVPTNTEELKQQLATAQATIVKLKDEATQGLRQRKIGTDSQRSGPGTVTATLQRAPANGVPVPYVAGLCLISFILAYFFF
ncbi:VAMP-associated protein [Pseudovirgaria hyperparasitica]|uniref:VAMP-associated protein n=1 Tax=Pseudovirgaria hyperparasitica TaxID=470096 RepID=A0A6A6W9R7_9PEZI|nr:VAMP-associated protein [Pseudovirgaria hyperparasitica]KAF2759592.1 VAMP-associated protein [Pseudovirgaria hyperparasitica]